MSDRARSSVRTGTRDGSGTTDEAPEATPAPAAAQAPAAAPAARSGASSAHSTADRAASPAAEGQQGSGKGPADDATVAATPENAPTRGEQPAASPAPPAAHPVTPLGPTAPSARAAADGARPVGSPAPPVPTSAGRSAAPAPLDATQAVSLPAGGARPVDPASRPPAARPVDPNRSADANRAADAGRSDGDTTTRSGGGKARGVGRGPRRARLQLRHIDTWSALKISLVVSIALFFVWMVAVGILYGVLGGLGVFESLNGLIGQLSSSSGSDVASNVISAKVILGGAAVIGAVNIVLLTALCTVAAFVYNLCSDLVGGLEVTLAERD